jgi:23S rRNA (uracil1939-C5)-methyltransferase
MMTLEATRKLKRDFVVAALAQRGLSPAVDETVGLAPASRRRAVLTALRVGKRLLLGYHERLSHLVVDIEECPVLAPQLQARLADIRRLVGPLVTGRKPARVTVLLTTSGLDIDVSGVRPPSARAIAQLGEDAAAHGLARLSISGETLLALAEPALKIAGVPLAPPSGGFVQASAEAEAAMTRLVTEHLAGAKSAADLFAGIGTFALALARDASVRAVEANGPALATLIRAAHHASRLKPIMTERRDLFTSPLTPAELDRFGAVVIDPPYAGAKAQAETLAQSKVGRIASVSCNPATFARDARILVDGGYRLESVTPIDQFVYSAETEMVGLFRRV